MKNKTDWTGQQIDWLTNQSYGWLINSESIKNLDFGLVDQT